MYKNMIDLKFFKLNIIQSFSQFQMGVLFEVITRWMVPQEMKFWYDYKI